MKIIKRITSVSDLNDSLATGIACFSDTDENGSIRQAYYTNNLDFVLFHGGYMAYNELNSKIESDDAIGSQVYAYDIINKKIVMITPSQFIGYVNHVSSLIMKDKNELAEILGLVEEFGFEELDINEYMCTPDGTSAFLLSIEFCKWDRDQKTLVFLVGDDEENQVTIKTDGCGIDVEDGTVEIISLNEYNSRSQVNFAEKEGYIAFSEQAEPVWINKSLRSQNESKGSIVFPALAIYHEESLVDIVILAN